jgi:branched-subunit amino acid transport protein
MGFTKPRMPRDINNVLRNYMTPAVLSRLMIPSILWHNTRKQFHKWDSDITDIVVLKMILSICSSLPYMVQAESIMINILK